MDKATLTRQCGEALQELGLPQEAVEMMMALRDKGRAPEDPEGLASKVRPCLLGYGGVVPGVRQCVADVLAGQVCQGRCVEAGV